jgi:hypothetical protein
MTKTSRHSVADYRVSHSLAHHKTRPGCLGRPWRVRGQCVYDQATLAGPRTAAHDDPKVLTEPQTRGSRQHGVPRRQSNQADSVSRPLRRRAAKMARPARVRILSRNPWVRARRRLFGWKVRLPLLTAQNLLVSTCSRPSSGVSCSSTAVSGFSYQRVASSLLATTTRARETDPLLAGDLTRVRTRFRATETAPSTTHRDRPLPPATDHAAAPNGNTPYTVKCLLLRVSCGRARGLLTCLSQLTGPRAPAATHARGSVRRRPTHVVLYDGDAAEDVEASVGVR